MEISGEIRISALTRDTTIILDDSRIFILSPKSPNLSPNGRQGQRYWLGSTPSGIQQNLCKCLFPTIRLTLLGNNIPCSQQYERCKTQMSVKYIIYNVKSMSNVFLPDDGT
ncbi:hypothetical protein AVEN_232381-1 [Araneus ventricosus]|uniref:Uncharacterized protein n=1 Tax=Araneus ventricosus TaxID=182803 RepID=A0A4Y2CU23_ARAVE|nr:hypothetical protein AVEN_232381-1 [Araneus ventricosus]